VQTGDQPTMGDGRIVIAVVGHFQFGKSSLINCLLSGESRKAPVGNGWKSETSETDQYDLPNGDVLLDTPGVNDTAERDTCAMEAIKQAHCVLFVGSNERDLSEVYSNLAWQIKEQNKPCAFVLNCCRKEGKYWDPRSEVNADVCKNGIGASFIGKNGFDMFMEIGGGLALPVNVCWAQYGLGELEDDELIDDVETKFRKEGVGDSQLRDVAWARSNVSALREFVLNVRLELLSHFLRNKDLVIQKMADAFCAEFAKRVTPREGR